MELLIWNVEMGREGLKKKWQKKQIFFVVN